ncbi:hypothetical protein RUND412_002692 [Rhizina undulata]
MRVTALLAVTFASFAAAQSSSATACAAQYIVDACVQTEDSNTTCTPNDWECMCNKATNLLTCYNNCPNDSAKFGYQSQQTAYCGAASAASSQSVAAATASAAAASTKTGSVTAATATAVESSNSGSATESSHSSGSATTGSAATAASTHTSNAGNAIVPGGFGAVAGMIALAGALL